MFPLHTPHYASPLAFIPSPPPPAAGLASWQATQKIATRHTACFSSTHLKSFEDDSNESESDNSPTADPMSSITSTESDDFSNTPPPRAAPNMGASIGAEIVGEMLFNEQLLKSGRGDVRIGFKGRWKDFRGNEIVTDGADELN